MAIHNLDKLTPEQNANLVNLLLGMVQKERGLTSCLCSKSGTLTLEDPDNPKIQEVHSLCDPWGGQYFKLSIGKNFAFQEPSIQVSGRDRKDVELVDALPPSARPLKEEGFWIHPVKRYPVYHADGIPQNGVDWFLYVQHEINLSSLFANEDECELRKRIGFSLEVLTPPA